MASTSTVFFSQVDGIGYDADPSSTVTPNPMILGGRSLKFAGSVAGTTSLTASATAIYLTLAGNLVCDGLMVSNSRPSVYQQILPNYVAVMEGLPYRIAAGVFVTVFAGGLLRIKP